MNVDGTITFTLEPFTLDGKMVAWAKWQYRTGFFLADGV